MRYDKSLIFFTSVALALPGYGISQLEQELQNLRELPFGYVANCQDGDLRIEGPNSATFWIRKAEVCALQTPAEESPFCIAGAPGEDVATGRKIPDCYTLKTEVI